MIRQFMTVAGTKGLKEALRLASRRLWPTRLGCWRDTAALFHGRVGLEIGGPSPPYFRSGLFPVYAAAARIDNVNFGCDTIWEGRIEEGATFRFHPNRAPGRQFIAEAADLGEIADAAYDFVLSSHTLEHVANPLRSLAEWKRVLKPDGAFALFLPHKEATFDHRRPVTTLEHLVADFDNATPESDRTHFDECLRLHDLSRDAGSPNFEFFKQRAERNLENRCLHHHVFDTALAVEVVHHAGFQILVVEPTRPHHIFVLAKKSSLAPNNALFRDPKAGWRRCSPFQMDQPPQGETTSD